MTTPNVSKAQDIESLRKRYTELDRRKAAAEANLKTATENLDVLKEQARKTYGTDNLDELRAKLEEMRRENDRKRSDYQQHLEQIESRLSEIEREYGTARIGAGERM
jgi:chromosome segregation ATPase